MAKFLTRAAALLATVLLMVSMAACQSTATPSPTPAPPSAAPASEPVEQPTTAQASQPAPTASSEPITLKYWTAYDSTGTSGLQDNLIMQELTKKTGVVLDLTFNMKQENYNAMLASGDLPDAFTVWNKDVKNLIDGGNVIDMEPLLAQYGKDILLDSGKIQFGKSFLSEGQSKLYFLPTWGIGLDAQPPKSFNNGTGIGAYIRWDLYKKIGYPAWEGDLLDLIPILKQMQGAQPTTADGKKVYALSPWLGDWGLWNFTIYYQGFDSMFAEAGGFVDIDVTNYAMKSQILDPTSTLWKGAKFLNKANQAGILDPDSLMQKFDQTMDKAKSGRVLMQPCNWCAPSGDVQKIDPSYGFMDIKMPSTKTMISNLFRTPFTDRWSMGITSKCKTPDKAMTLINFLNSDEGMRLLLNGVEGVHWNVGSDGIPHLTPETLAVINGTASEDPKYAGFGSYTHLYGYSQDSWDAAYKCQASFKYNESPDAQMASAAAVVKDYTEHYKVAYPDQLFEQTLPDMVKIFDGSFTQMVDQTPTDIKQIDDNLQNYLLVELVNIVNAKTDADFDAAQAKIIGDCKNRDAERAYQWHVDTYKAAIDKVQVFYNSIK